MSRVGSPNRSGCALLRLALPVSLLLAGPSCSRKPSRPALAMEKYVSPQAAFAVYKPRGWKVAEQGRPGFQALTVTDPAGQFEAVMSYGTLPPGMDARAFAGSLAAGMRGRFPDFTVSAARASAAGDRLAFDGTYSAPGRGRREMRTWVSGQGGEFVCSTIEAPGGRLGEQRQVLLTILSNVRAIKGGLAGGVPRPVTMALHRLGDGSASFRMPVDWRCQDFGKGSFAANDPSGAYGFLVGSVDLITPRLGVRPRGVLVSPTLPPSQAWQFVTGQLGLASSMTFRSVIPRPDLAQPMAQVYTAGPVQVEEFVYTCQSKGHAVKGYSMGITFGSRLDTNWNFRHLSVVAPVERFDAYLVNYVAMLESYRIDDAWAQQYIAQGLQRLRQLQQQTAALVARNAQEIRSMMQAAYDERQRSMDYIDYQRTSYIRGTQDWVSSSEGGAVYQSDSWGTRNLATGDSWQGQPYNYVNFDGRNPRQHEQMQAIDSRELFENYRR